MNRSGFTLVEAIVVGVIAAVIGAIFIPLFYVHNAAVSEGTAHSKMRLQAVLVSEEIGRSVRTANLALASTETWSSIGRNAGITDVSEMHLYDNAGNLTQAYRITGGILYQSQDGTSFLPFTVGGETVHLVSGSVFRLSSNRREAALMLKIAIRYRSQDYHTVSQGELYQCRN